MKKALAICLALVMAVSAAMMVFAAPGGFVSSPSGNEAPVIITVSYEDDSCNPKVVVTPYSERDTLEEEKEEDMNEAYDEIAANKNLSGLCSELSSVAAAKNIPVSRLAVSDLFDISAYHNGDHDFCGSITVTVGTEALRNFVALLHRDADGTWEVVPGVIVNVEEGTITFSADDFSPYAIVVDTGSNAIPDTGADIYIPAIAMIASAVSLVFVLFSMKKKQKA